MFKRFEKGIGGKALCNWTGPGALKCCAISRLTWYENGGLEVRIGRSFLTRLLSAVCVQWVLARHFIRHLNSRVLECLQETCRLQQGSDPNPVIKQRKEGHDLLSEQFCL